MKFVPGNKNKTKSKFLNLDSNLFKHVPHLKENYKFRIYITTSNPDFF